MKEENNENNLRYKAEVYCSLTEHCVSEVEAKLEKWGADGELKSKIIQHLISEKYIDEQRYCVAFVRDKYRFNQWGKIKIAQALRMKYISSDIIDESMNEIDEEEYLNILSSLICRKRKSISARTEYERNRKLISFAAGRGFEMKAIFNCVKQTDVDEEDFE